RVWIYGFNKAVFIMRQAGDFHASQMSDAAGQTGIVIEQIPFTVERADGMMGSPAHNGVEDSSAVPERPVGRDAGCVTKEMGISRGIRKVILTVEFVHPAGFEEPSVVITGQQRAAVFIRDRY